MTAPAPAGGEKQPIDVYFKLREYNLQKGAHKGKATASIEFVVPEAAGFSGAEEAKIAGFIAKNLVRNIKRNMLKGHDPNGEPLPAASEKTMQRRVHRAFQALRFGHADDRYTDPKYRAKVRENFFRRFSAVGFNLRKNAGAGVPAGVFGIESGLMLKTMKSRATPEGTWQIFFDKARALPNRHGESAVNRVWSRIKILPEKILADDALKKLKRALWKHRMVKLLEEFKEIAESVVELADRADAAIDDQSGVEL